MKNNGVEIFLIAMVISTVCLTFFAYFGNRLFSRFDFSAAGILRRKTVTKPTITCSLPIQEAGRPEAPLW